MQTSSENWLKIAKYDLKVAGDCFKSKNYIAAVEKCHNALEKLLKGIITESNREPAKVHDLLRLASEALITNLQSDAKDLMQELNMIYINTRYPDEFDMIYEQLDKNESEKLIKQTRSLFKWLEKKLTEN